MALDVGQEPIDVVQEYAIEKRSGYRQPWIELSHAAGQFGDQFIMPPDSLSRTLRPSAAGKRL